MHEDVRKRNENEGIRNMQVQIKILETGKYKWR
jgi:hypothetical protein